MDGACPQLSRDVVIYTVKQVEIAYRMGAIEVNTHEDAIMANRVFCGNWVIISSQINKRSTLEELLKKFVGKARTTKPIKLAEAKLYVGSYSVGKVEKDAVEPLAKYVEDMVALIESYGCSTETIAVYSEYGREIRHSDGVAREYKGVTDVILTVDCGFPLSIRLAELGMPSQDQRLMRMLIADMVAASKAMRKAPRLNPLYAGKTTVILRLDAAGALLHEIGHLLEANHSGLRVRIGSKIASTLVTIIDDPFNPHSPAYTRFDDEAVETLRKTLVEEGEVVSLLHTRETAAIHGGTPGNAKGLFRKPTPSHTTLTMSPGDWRDSEIIEETRRAIVVDTIHMAYTEGSVITLIPERAWLLEKRELSPLKLNRIRIRLDQGLYTIDAISRTPWLRVSIEHDHYVAEYVPTIRLIAYVD